METNEKDRIEISSDILIFLKQNKIIQSHEKLYSDDFILMMCYSLDSETKAHHHEQRN